jgi:hypothetical protein
LRWFTALVTQGGAAVRPVIAPAGVEQMPTGSRRTISRVTVVLDLDPAGTPRRFGSAGGQARLYNARPVPARRSRIRSIDMPLNLGRGNQESNQFKLCRARKKGDDDGQEDSARQKARPSSGCRRTGSRGPIRGEEDGKVEGQCKARSEKGRSVPEKGRARPLVNSAWRAGSREGSRGARLSGYGEALPP